MQVIKKRVFVIISELLISLFLVCTSPTKDDNEIILPSINVGEFNITGKVKNKNGNPMEGAVASLIHSGLSSITDENGFFTIKGEPTSNVLSKRKANDTLTDTLVITIKNQYGDSSEISRSKVKSGVFLDLPTNYLVQRNISGPIRPDDTARVGSIVAIVYDKAFPDQKNSIKLWHDKVNKQFNSFAYFSADTGKSYRLYVEAYDTAGRFLGRSTCYDFTDQTGDIEFTKPFEYDNGKPHLKVWCNRDIIYVGDTVQFHVEAADSFGLITDCSLRAADTLCILAIPLAQNVGDVIDYIVTDSSAKQTFTASAKNSFENINDTSITINVLKYPAFPPKPRMSYTWNINMGILDSGVHIRHTDSFPKMVSAGLLICYDTLVPNTYKYISDLVLPLDSNTSYKILSNDSVVSHAYSAESQFQKAGIGSSILYNCPYTSDTVVYFTRSYIYHPVIGYTRKDYGLASFKYGTDYDTTSSKVKVYVQYTN